MLYAVQALLLLAGTFCALVSCAQAMAPVVERQEIAVTLSPESHLLRGRTSTTLSTGGDTLAFSLAPHAVIDGITAAGKPARFSFTNGRIALSLPAPHQGPMSIIVEYHALFDDVVPQRPANDEDPTFGVAAAITRDGIFLGSGAGWYPVPSAPPKRRTISITAPAGIEAVTSGRRVARETSSNVTRSTWEEDRPVEQLSVSAGPYLVQEKREHGIDFYSYLYRDNTGLSSRYLAASSKYVQFYSGILGPYPFSKFAVVENFLPTGYGFPSYTLLGSSVIRLPFIVDTSLPHEIAHSWWGNGVLVDYRDGNWSEGLVTYLADYLLKEKQSTVAGSEYRLQILTDYATLVKADNDFPLREFTSRVDPASRAIGYGKSAMVFHMVRTMLGDEAFFRGLREVCREKLFRTATWQDFERIFSRTGGVDIAPFMEQWLQRTGGPRFALADIARRRDRKGWLVSGTVVQTAPFYDLILPVGLETAEGAVRQDLKISGKRTPFSFTVTAAPRRVVLDPDAEVFRLLSPAELPPTVNMLKSSGQLLVVTTKSCQAREETLRLLLESLGQQRARIVPEESLNDAAIRQNDLLFCGVPQDQALFSLLPQGTTVSSRTFTIDGTRYEDSQDLLFLTLKHPVEKRTIALFLPLSKKAADDYVLKITHYGKYGYLVFSGGRNVRKGMSSIPGGESAVELTGEPL